MAPDYPSGALPLADDQMEKCRIETNCKTFCNHKPYDARVRWCNWFGREQLSPKTNIDDGINKLLDEEELEKEKQEEQDEKKHFLIEVEDEKVADNSGPELDDEGHGKNLNRINNRK